MVTGWSGGNPLGTSGNIRRGEEFHSRNVLMQNGVQSKLVRNNKRKGKSKGGEMVCKLCLQASKRNGSYAKYHKVRWVQVVRYVHWRVYSLAITRCETRDWICGVVVFVQRFWSGGSLQTGGCSLSHPPLHSMLHWLFTGFSLADSARRFCFCTPFRFCRVGWRNRRLFFFLYIYINIYIFFGTIFLAFWRPTNHFFGFFWILLDIFCMLTKRHTINLPTPYTVQNFHSLHYQNRWPCATVHITNEPMIIHHF